MLVLFTDTDCDFTPEKAKEYGYNLISMPYSIGEKEVYPYVDFKTFESKKFYDMLRGGTLPKTSAISPERYKEYFEPFLKEGNDILYVHFSKAMSGTFNALNVALEDLKETYPDRTVYLIDTKGITILAYLIGCEIGELVKQGKTIDEILEWSKEEINKTAVYFYADNLNFFKASGRVSNLSALMGNLFGFHPIISMGIDGMMTGVGKARGRVKSLQRIVNIVKELQEDIHHHKIIIGHTDCLEIAQKVEKFLKEEFGDDLDIEYVVVNPTAGAHCGPDCVGVCFHAIHR